MGDIRNVYSKGRGRSWKRSMIDVERYALHCFDGHVDDMPHIEKMFRQMDKILGMDVSISIPSLHITEVISSYSF